MENDVVRQATLFNALDDEAAQALRESMAESRLRRGEVLFHEGDSGDKLYIVTDGKVKLGRTSSDGRENLLAILVMEWSAALVCQSWRLAPSISRHVWAIN